MIVATTFQRYKGSPNLSWIINCIIVLLFFITVYLIHFSLVLDHSTLRILTNLLSNVDSGSCVASASWLIILNHMFHGSYWSLRSNNQLLFEIPLSHLISKRSFLAATQKLWNWLPMILKPSTSEYIFLLHKTVTCLCCTLCIDMFFYFFIFLFMSEGFVNFKCYRIRVWHFGISQ